MAVIPHGSLHRLDIVATSNFRAPPNELHPLVKHLVAAGGALGIFARRSYCNIWGGNITFRVESDDDGNDRGYALTLSHKQWSPHATNIWQQICAHHERLTSQSVEVDLETSSWFARAFKLCPPSAAPLELLFDPAIAEKHISSDVAGEGYFSPPPIYIPSLHYVTLARYSCDVAFLEDVLYFLADGYLLSDEPVADICICNILLPKDCNMPRALARLQFMLHNLYRRRLDRRHIPVWYICDHWVRNDTYAVPLPPESLFDRTDACPCCPDTSGHISE